MATYAGNTDAGDIAANLNSVDAVNPPLQADFLNDVKDIADPGDAILNENQGKTFVLTTSFDNPTGTAYDDVFIGDNSNALSPTVQVADSINGSGGDNDTFKYYAYNGVMPQMKSIETLDLIAATKGINTTSYTDLKNIVVERWAAGAAKSITYLSTQSLDFVNNNNSKAIKLQPDTGSKIAVTLDSNSQLNLSAKATAVDATKVTELDLTAVGTNKGVTVSRTGTNLATVKILGDGSIELINKAGAIVYDASGNQGGVTVTAAATSDIPFKFIGSSGVDTLNVGATTFTSTLDSQLQNVENIVLTTGSKTLNLSSQTEGFNITGSTGNNTIIGSQGADTIDAGKGNDTIRGKVGADTITTGAGTDKVIFDDFRTADKITDFATGTDKLYIDWAKNTKAANYLLNTKAFVLNAAKTKVTAVKVVTPGTAIIAKKPFGTVNWSGVTAPAAAIKLSNTMTATKSIPLVSAANFTKLYTLLEKVATMTSNANALVFARTSASGKLYFGAIIDVNTATKGLLLGDKITIKTIATVTGNFDNADIYIM